MDIIYRFNRNIVVPEIRHNPVHVKLFVAQKVDKGSCVVRNYVWNSIVMGNLKKMRLKNNPIILEMYKTLPL